MRLFCVSLCFMFVIYILWIKVDRLTYKVNELQKEVSTCIKWDSIKSTDCNTNKIMLTTFKKGN